MRWGLGPVFLYECLANSRRWQTYAIRSAGVAVILVSISMIATSHQAMNPALSWRDYAALGESYFYAVIGVELTLVLLAAPAATAGALCVDRARGTLDHMLATELSDPEIVLGKLAARLLPVLGLVACSWPVLALASLLGGIDPVALTLAFAIILAVALLGCTMALALSVWARKPHEVVLVVYTFWALALLLWPIWWVLAQAKIAGPPPDWSLVADPYYLAFAPYSAPSRFGFEEYLGFFAATLGTSAALAILAVWRMRPVARRGTDDHRRGPRLGWAGRIARWLPGPALDGNPVLWREWHRSRPSRWVTILIVVGGGLTGLAVLVGGVTALTHGLDPRPGPPEPAILAGLCAALLQLIFGLLMLSAAAPTSMAEERQRGSLDLLAATALSTRTIVLGKWLGTLRQVALLAVGPGWMGLALAASIKPPQTIPLGAMARYYEEVSEGVVFLAAGVLIATILVHGALIASVGLALATWIARQSRAIALSVGFAVLVGAGWPILIGVNRMGPAGEGLMYLSPVMAFMGLTEVVASRHRYGTAEALWWITFWDLEVLVLAMGLLWLAVRTFDRCFGRIPERHGRAPVLSDVVVVLAAVLGVGGLFGAIAAWIHRIREFMPVSEIGVVACTIAVAVGFYLIAALAATTTSRSGGAPAAAPGPAAVLDRKSFAIRWWEAFRLVLLLAIGPALVALAMATAPEVFRVATTVKPLPGGGSVRIETNPQGETWAVTTDAAKKVTFREATEAEIAAAGPAVPLRDHSTSLTIAALAIATILAHGAAFVSLGAALGVWIGRRGRAIAASVVLVILVTAIWPMVYIPAGYFYLEQPWGWALASVLLAYGGLVFHIHRPDSVAPDVAGWAAYWDVIMILVAVIAAGLAIRTMERRCRESAGPAGLPDPEGGGPASTGLEAEADPVLAEHG
jgi:ABC-type transport system involved in multi-copper enzyme maturation permease subunit